MSFFGLSNTEQLMLCCRPIVLNGISTVNEFCSLVSNGLSAVLSDSLMFILPVVIVLLFILPVVIALLFILPVVIVLLFILPVVTVLLFILPVVIVLLFILPTQHVCAEGLSRSSRPNLSTWSARILLPCHYSNPIDGW